MAKSRVFFQLIEVLRVERKYWLLPVVVVFALLGMLVVFAQSSAIAPFIYTLF